MGLLSKANLLEKPTISNGLAFSNLIKNNNLSYLILFQKNNEYSVINSFGLDAKSIQLSLSTQDFWNGLCPSSNEIYTFSKSENTIGPFLQFFSSEIIDKLSKISLVKLPNENIFLVCNSQISDELKNELLMFDENVLQNELSSLPQTENYLNFSLDCTSLQNVYNNFYASVVNEIYNRLLCSYFKDIYITKDTNILKFAINKQECNNPSVLIKHILANLTEVLEDNINLITIKAE